MKEWDNNRMNGKMNESELNKKMYGRMLFINDNMNRSYTMISKMRSVTLTRPQNLTVHWFLRSPSM